MDAVTPKAQARAARQASQNDVARELGAFICTVMAAAQPRTLREAALELVPDEIVAAGLRDRLQHMLFVAAATLCDSASLNPAGDAATSTGVADIVRSAQDAIAAVENAGIHELAEAHAYFLAPPWRDELEEPQRQLADLSFGVARFMIECASDCLVPQG